MIGQKRYKAVSSIKSTILASHSHERIQLIGQRILVVQTKHIRSTSHCKDEQHPSESAEFTIWEGLETLPRKKTLIRCCRRKVVGMPTNVTGDYYYER